MKRQIILFISMVILTLELSACGISSKNRGESNTSEISTEKETNDINTIPSDTYVSSNYNTKTDKNSYEHKHTLSNGNNIVAHEAVGYCGNTMTTVYKETLPNEEPWEISFWGDDSVNITDLLRYLNYNEDICECFSEYTVKTEFGTEYEINLTEGYARYNDNQVSLTEEQVTLIQEIFDRQSKQ